VAIQKFVVYQNTGLPRFARNDSMGGKIGDSPKVLYKAADIYNRIAPRTLNISPDATIKRFEALSAHSSASSEQAPQFEISRSK